MSTDKLLLLQSELRNMDSAAVHLRYSIERTAELLARDDWQPDELERLESLASRFARLADLLIQRVMRLVDDLELIASSTLLDRIQRAEKRRWADNAVMLIRIRELRNLMAHEYAADRPAEIYAAVATLAPELLAIVAKAHAYTNQLIQNYPTKPSHR